MSRPREFDEGAALDGAVETFWSGSYAGTSTQDLCESTGLSRSSLYNTFHGKSDLYQGALRRYDELRDEERREYLDRPGTGREVLEELLTQVVRDQWAATDRRTCLVINAAVEVGSSDADVAAVARGNLERFSDTLAQLIARGQRDGSLTCDGSPHDVADVVHATLNGLQVAGRVATSEDPARNAVRTLMSLL